MGWIGWGISFYSRRPEEGIVLWSVKIHRNDGLTDFGVWCWLFRIRLWMLKRSSVSHAPGWVLPLLDPLRQKTHHLFIVHLLDLLKVNRIPDSCWTHTQSGNGRCENICCLANLYSRIRPHPKAKQHEIPDLAMRKHILEVPRMANGASPVLWDSLPESFAGHRRQRRPSQTMLLQTQTRGVWGSQGSCVSLIHLWMWQCLESESDKSHFIHGFTSF